MPKSKIEKFTGKPERNPLKKEKNKLPVFDRVPRYKKFNGEWYIISDISFTLKNAKLSLERAKKVYGNGRIMKYKHKSGSIEYAIYVKNPKSKYGYNPK